jgi:CRP-like cAMP-binding protein
MAHGAVNREQVSQLSKNWLLATIQPGVVDLLFRRGELITLKRGAVLYEPEAALTDCYFPLDCIISLLAVLDNDRSAEVAVFGPESVAAYIGVTLGAEAFGRYVVMISGRALMLSTRALNEVIGEQPELGQRLRAFSVAFTRQTFQFLACNACHSVEQRCCKWLLTMADKACTNQVPITHDHLAQMLGVQRPTVSIIMRELQSAGLVEQKRGCICIVDRTRLLRLSCECYEKAKAIYSGWLPGA